MRLSGPLLFCAAVAGCGGSDPPKLNLTLASTYDLAAAIRVAPEGGVPSSFLPLYLAFDSILVGGGRTRGTFGVRQGAAPVSFSATFSAVTGELAIDPLEAAITATTSERIDELGGRADDILPKDGIADELAGFFRSRRGIAIYDGTLLGSARSDRRPRAPDDTKIEVREVDVGHVTVTGAAGAMVAAAGVEIFRFGLGKRDPEFAIGQAKDDGSFSVTVPGIREDLFGVRARAIGVAGDARFFRVTQ